VTQLVVNERMARMSRVWINGQLIDKIDARISPFDHGFLYGDGVWEHLRVCHGQPYHLAGHLQCLEQSTDSLGIALPHSRDELAAAITTVLAANERTNGYVRVIVSRGPGTLGPDPRKINPQVLIIAEEYQPFPRELYGHGLHAVTVPISPFTPEKQPPVRTLGQPHLVQAKRLALQQGCLEAILLRGSTSGPVIGLTEGILFLVKDFALIIAEGQPRDVTGHAVAALAASCVQTVVEYEVHTEDLLAADECCVAGAACGVIGIVQVNGQKIGSGTEGPITRMIRDRYQADTSGDIE
jgi:branched-chain amino acid aminotransferase